MPNLRTYGYDKNHKVVYWIAVSFGGCTGLFLGGSLLSCVELMYFLTLRLYCQWKNWNKQGQKENVVTKRRYWSTRKFDKKQVPGTSEKLSVDGSVSNITLQKAFHSKSPRYASIFRFYGSFKHRSSYARRNFRTFLAKKFLLRVIFKRKKKKHQQRPI